MKLTIGHYIVIIDDNDKQIQHIYRKDTDHVINDVKIDLVQTLVKEIAEMKEHMYNSSMPVITNNICFIPKRLSMC